MDEYVPLVAGRPKSVHGSWDAYFRTDTYQPNHEIIPGATAVRPGGASASNDAANMVHLADVYMARGHEKADLDPLGLRREAVFLDAVEDVDDALQELDYKNCGFTRSRSGTRNGLWGR